MELENQLKQLEDLEVGNVEKAIGEIENYKYDLEKINDEINEGVDAYKEMFIEKVSKSIDNILLMKNYIFKGEEREIQLKGQITLKVDYKKNSIKIIRKYRDVGVSCDPKSRIIEIFLKRQKLKKISLYSTWRELSMKGKIQIIKAKNQIDFSEKLCDLISFDKSYEEFIYAMNDIPKKISEQYSKRKEYAQSTRESVNSDYKKLKQLQVSDF